MIGRRWVLAVSCIAAAACVDVPNTIRVQFAPPTASDRSNFRRGLHGTAVAAPPKAGGANAPAGSSDTHAIPPSVGAPDRATPPPTGEEFAVPSRDGVRTDGGVS